MEQQIQQMDTRDIKAHCYDLLAQQQNIQQTLAALNQELARRAQQPKSEVIEPEIVR